MSEKVQRLSEQVLNAYVIGKTGGIRRGHRRGFRRFLRLIGRLRAKGHDQPEEVLRIEWMATDRLKQIAERPIETVTRRIFEAQRREVVSQLRQRDEETRSRTGPDHTKDPALVAALFDLESWNRRFEDEIDPAAIEAMQDGFRNALRRIGREDIEDAFNADRPLIRRTINEIESQSRLVNRQTQEVINQVVTDGLAEGQSFGDMADRLDDRFENWKTWRARTHARTAGTAAFEAGQTDSFDLANVPRRSWLSQRDGRVRGLDADDRFDHFSADGQVADAGQPFEVSGELLRFPGDPSGSPGNIINCRCTQLPQTGSES